MSSSRSSPAPIRNVVVIGGAYAGGHCADLLAKTLPPTHRVVLVDRQSHFNHLYLFPRVGVVPGHANKVFVPFGGLLARAAQPPPNTIPPPSVTDAPSAKNAARDNIFINAGVTKITDSYIELDRDVPVEGVAATEGGDEVDELSRKLEQEGIEEKKGKNVLDYDYLVYATGCTLPKPILSPAVTKNEGVAFLQAQTATIAAASSILIAGGGALGIQYATDIADLYNNPAHADKRPADARPGPKKITLVHSRDRFLPLYKQPVHDEILKRMQVLGVEVVFGERLALPEVDEGMVTTSAGKEIEFDLLLRCTGQKPNSGLLAAHLPESLDEYGYVNVKSTTQVSLPESSSQKADNIFVIGDVANAGVIKAGHTGWNQSCITAQNIVNMISAENAPDAASVADPSASIVSPAFVHYEPSPPQIKVTTGLGYSVTEGCVAMGDKDTVISTIEGEGPIDGYWQVIWSSVGADSSDPDL